MTEVRGEAVHVCARILLKYTLNVDEENKVGGKLTVWFICSIGLGTECLVGGYGDCKQNAGGVWKT